MGRDAKGIDPLVYKKLQVIKVERVENAPLFEKYAENRAKLFRKVGRGVGLNKLEQTGKAQKGPIITTTEDILLRDVYPAVNEYYLFHGTPVEIVDAIVTQGLDARLNKRGMFGPAVYAAESSTKSDSYAGEEHILSILFKVCLSCGYHKYACFPAYLRVYVKCFHLFNQMF